MKLYHSWWGTECETSKSMHTFEQVNAPAKARSFIWYMRNQAVLCYITILTSLALVRLVKTARLNECCVAWSENYSKWNSGLTSVLLRFFDHISLQLTTLSLKVILDYLSFRVHLLWHKIFSQISLFAYL